MTVAAPLTWEPNWIDFRSSVANVERRRDRGEIPATCDACGCETDIIPAPHSPKCPTLLRGDWTREETVAAVKAWKRERGRAPFASDWPAETKEHPSAKQVVLEFGSWQAFLDAAGLEAPANRYGRTYREPLPPPAVEGLELLERMDAGESVGLEEVEEPPAGESPPEPAGPSSSASSSPRHPNTKWTREKVVAAIREVAGNVGHTPSRAEMAAAGYGGVLQVSVTSRLGVTVAELMREAGFEPNTRAAGPARRRAESSGREPQADTTPSAKGDPGLDAAVAGASSRPDDESERAEPPAPAARPPETAARSDRLFAIALVAGARAFADALEQELGQ